MPHRILKGNLFESEAVTLVNAVNCVGVMGKGIAQLFKERYPAMFVDKYQEWGIQSIAFPSLGCCRITINENH